MDEKMFCFQCEQAANGCTACAGQCGCVRQIGGDGGRAGCDSPGRSSGLPELLVELGQPIQPPQALLLIGGIIHHHHECEL